MILYRYLKIDNEGWFWKLLVNGEIYFSSPTLFNDLLDSRIIIAPVSKSDGISYEYYIEGRLQLDHHVLCFTTQNSSTLMWAHYADSNRGICIGINVEEKDGDIILPIKDIKRENLIVRPVEYISKSHCKKIIDKSKENPNLSDENLSVDTFFRKDNCWKYEKEIRAVIKAENPKNPRTLRHLKEGAISEIYFGALCPQSIRIAIQRLCLCSNLACSKAKTFTMKPVGLEEFETRNSYPVLTSIDK